MNVPASPSSAAGVVAAQPIPYRTDAPVTAGKALSVFGLTVALLAAAVGVLLWARRRGGAGRWPAAAVGGGQPGRNVPRVLGQARVGPSSRAFVIDVDGARFVVVESSRQVSLHALPDAGATPEEGHE